MRFEELMARVGDGGLFRTGQILAGVRSARDVRRQLDRWVKSGRVLRLRREVYMLARPYNPDMPHPFLVANTLKKASYVSLQSALEHHGMIPEDVPVTTSVTTGRPEEIETPIGRFLFRHVRTSLFHGFVEDEIAPGQWALVADTHKALVDLLYLTAHSDRIAYLRELRLARPERFDEEALRVAAARSGSGKVERAVKRLLDDWRREDLR
jgi:predicted transcriptional regulator of viral defense system